MLELNNLTLKRGRNPVLSGFSASAAAGEPVVLLGENGCGKTSLLSAIAGVLEGGGSILLDGLAAEPQSDEWSSCLSYVPDDGGSLPLLTVSEQLHLQGYLSGLNEASAAARAEELMELFELESFSAYRGEELSAGLRKKLGIALGLVRSADIYLFDEPFSNLDLSAASVLVDIMKILRQRHRYMIVSTHTPSILKDVCGKIWIMRDGKAVEKPAGARLPAAFGSRLKPLGGSVSRLGWIGGDR